MEALDELIKSKNKEFNINLHKKKLYYIQWLTGLDFEELLEQDKIIIDSTIEEVIKSLEERKQELENTNKLEKKYLEILNDILKFKDELINFYKLN